MSNFQLAKGATATISAAIIDYDNNPDLTTVVALGVSPAGALVITPVAPPAGQAVRQWTVTVPAAATVSTTGVTIGATSSIPATGSGAGAGAAFKTGNYPLIDTVVPVDHRAMSLSGPI